MCVYIRTCVVCVSVCVKCDGVRVSECEGESACQCFKHECICVHVCVYVRTCVCCVSVCVSGCVPVCLYMW